MRTGSPQPVQCTQPDQGDDEQKRCSIGKCLEEPDREEGENCMQAPAQPRPENRNQGDIHENEYWAEPLCEHQPHIGKPGFVIPAFMEVFDDAPKCPKASDKGGDPYRNPPCDLAFLRFFISLYPFPGTPFFRQPIYSTFC